MISPNNNTMNNVEDIVTIEVHASRNVFKNLVEELIDASETSAVFDDEVYDTLPNLMWGILHQIQERLDNLNKQLGERKDSA